MDTLKVKFKLNGLEFELEGNENTVKEELDSFKEFVMASLINRIGSINTHAENTSLVIPDNPENDFDYPQLKEIVIKDIPKTEVEWILVYGFYSSKYGKEAFRESDIKDMYELSKRKNLNRMKNFSQNFNKTVSNGYIKILNQEEYILVKKGIDRVAEILFVGKEDESKAANTENKFVKKGKKTKAKSAASGSTLSLVNTLNLNPPSQKSLKEYFGQFISKSFFERNLVFIYYLERVLKMENIGINHVYTCYKNVSEKVPGNLYQSLVDTKNAKGWIDTKDITNIKITIAGENFVEHDFPKS